MVFTLPIAGDKIVNPIFKDTVLGCCGPNYYTFPYGMWPMFIYNHAMYTFNNITLLDIKFINTNLLFRRKRPAFNEWGPQRQRWTSWDISRRTMGHHMRWSLDNPKRNRCMQTARFRVGYTHYLNDICCFDIMLELIFFSRLKYDNDGNRISVMTSFIDLFSTLNTTLSRGRGDVRCQGLMAQTQVYSYCSHHLPCTRWSSGETVS